MCTHTQTFTPQHTYPGSVDSVCVLPSPCFTLYINSRNAHTHANIHTTTHLSWTSACTCCDHVNVGPHDVFVFKNLFSNLICRNLRTVLVYSRLVVSYDLEQILLQFVYGLFRKVLGSNRTVAEHACSKMLCFTKNKMGSIIRSTGAEFYSYLYLNSRQGFNGLKYVYSVISDSLPGNTNNRESTRSWTSRVRWVHFWVILSVVLSPNGLPASRFRDKWQIWDGKR